MSINRIKLKTQINLHTYKHLFCLYFTRKGGSRQWRKFEKTESSDSVFFLKCFRYFFEIKHSIQGHASNAELERRAFDVQEKI